MGGSDWLGHVFATLGCRMAENRHASTSGPRHEWMPSLKWGKLEPTIVGSLCDGEKRRVA